MEAIRNCCHAAYTYPISREKLIVVGGGVLCAFLVAIILVIVCSGDDDSKVVVTGRDALINAPLIVGHNDLAQNLKAVLLNHLKNFTFTKIFPNDDFTKKCPYCKTDLSRLKAGMVATQVWTVTSSCDSLYKDSVPLVLEQIDVIKRLIDANSKSMSLLKTSQDIRDAFSNNNKKLGSLIAVDGGHTIDSRLAVLRMYYELGVRSISLGYHCSDKDKIIPWYNDTALSPFGMKIIKEMNRLGIVIDISKLPAAVQKEAITVSEAPVIIGNSNAYELCNVTIDNVFDEVLEELKNKSGLVMVSFNPALISPKESNITKEDLIGHITYLRKKMGSQFIGIGGGFDGFDKEVFELGDPSKFPVLFDALFVEKNDESKWALEDLEGLAGRNFLRVLESVEKKAKELQENYVADDDYEDRTELPSDETKLVCYSDLKQRYPSST